jgi:CspA family cold shock protein
METGTVNWFHDAKGYGFVTRDDGGTDVFIHHTNIVSGGGRSLVEGTKVVFKERKGTKGRLDVYDVSRAPTS